MGSLFVGGELLKMPFCADQSDAVSVWEIQNEGTGLYYMNYAFNSLVNSFFNRFFKDDVFYIWGYSSGVYQHPVKCTVTVTPVTLPINRVHFSTTGTLPTGGQTLFASKTFKTDLLSAVMDNYLSIGEPEADFMQYVPTTNTITIDVLTSSLPAKGYSARPVNGFYRIVKNDLSIVAYLTFLQESGGYTQYTFEYDYIEWNNAGGGIVYIMHIDTKYSVQVYSNGLQVGTFYYTPDDFFRFSMNLKPILSSLFDKRLFTTDTDPLATSFAAIQDLSSVFIRDVSLVISMNSPNLIRNSTMRFWTAPFRSTTCRGTLEEYLPAGDDSRMFITPFNKISYTSGIGGLMMAGAIVRMRQDTAAYGNAFVEYERQENVIDSDVLNAIGNDAVSFVLFKKIFYSPILPDAIRLHVGGGTYQHQACSIQLENLGTICKNVNLIWQGVTGVNSWFFESEYDEDWNVNDSITITNSEENTITNYNTTATRKLTIKARQLSKADKLGVSTIIEAKQLWIYSPTQSRLLPAKLTTKTAKIRQSNESMYDFSCDIEIQQGVTL